MSTIIERCKASAAIARQHSRMCIDRAHLRVNHSLWRIYSSQALLMRRRPPLSGGADHIPDEATIIERVRKLLDRGILPGIRTSEIAGEKVGGQQTCTICDLGIGVGEVGFALPPPEGVVVVVHRRCFGVWTREAADRRGGNGTVSPS